MPRGRLAESGGSSTRQASSELVGQVLSLLFSEDSLRPVFPDVEFPFCQIPWSKWASFQNDYFREGTTL